MLVLLGTASLGHSNSASDVAPTKDAAINRKTCNLAEETDPKAHKGASE